MTSSNLPARATAAQQNFPELAPNVEEAIRFMTWLAPHGPWHIYTIDAEGGAPVPMPFDFGPATNLEKCAVWIEQRNVARQNVYYSPNRPRAGVRKKASKEEMDVALWAYVDIDPCAGESLESEQKRILDLLQEERPASVPEPSAIVFSGGGYQVLLRLDQSIALTDAEKIEAYEARNRGLEDLLGGDNCHNCDRILRVPGTVNWPNKPKREKGRTPALAHVVGELSDVVVKITDLPKATNPLKPAVQSSSALEASPIRDIDELDRWNVPQRIKAIIETGPDARHPKKRDNSRSAWQLDATCQLVRSGIPDDTVMGILLDDAEDVDTQLARLGLTREPISRAAAAGYLARTNCTPNHPSNFGGIAQYADTIRQLRDELVPKGLVGRERPEHGSDRVSGEGYRDRRGERRREHRAREPSAVHQAAARGGYDATCRRQQTAPTGPACPRPVAEVQRRRQGGAADVGLIALFRP